MTTLKHNAATGVKWSTISQIGRLGTQFITTIILARLLEPSDFGLVGMAMVVISFIGIFKDLGTSAAVIQQRELSDELLSSVFWINVGFGFLAMMILFFGAPLGGLFYQEPRVVIVLQTLSISFFVSGLSILQQALLERSLAFDALARLEIISVFGGAFVGILMAFIGAGVWSLVFQSLITVILTTILLWRSSSWRPKRIFQWEEVKAVSQFSLNLTGFNIFNYFARNADYLLIGRYLGAQDLGYYTMAYRILLFPLQNISAVIGRVLYPVLSTIQDDNNRFSSAYLRVVGIIALITFPMMMGMEALAKPFVLSIFGEKWKPVILLILIFAPLGLLQSVGTTVGVIYQAKGRTDWLFRWGIFSGALVILAFILGLNWGIIGVAIAYAIVSLLLIYPVFAIPFRLIDLDMTSLIKVLIKPFLHSFKMMVLILGFIYFFSGEISNVTLLSLSIFIGGIFYAVANWMTNREQILELWVLIYKRGGIR